MGAESSSRLTALFEALVIDWLEVATIAEVARRQAAQPTAISIDETAFARRDEYVTVVSAEDRVMHVADGRSQAAYVPTDRRL